jgi:hypothetical protein
MKVSIPDFWVGYRWGIKIEYLLFEKPLGNVMREI